MENVVYGKVMKILRLCLHSNKECLKKSYQEAQSIKNRSIYMKSMHYYAVLKSHPLKTAKITKRN